MCGNRACAAARPSGQIRAAVAVCGGARGSNLAAHAGWGLGARRTWVYLTWRNGLEEKRVLRERGALIFGIKRTSSSNGTQYTVERERRGGPCPARMCMGAPRERLAPTELCSACVATYTLVSTPRASKLPCAAPHTRLNNILSAAVGVVNLHRESLEGPDSPACAVRGQCQRSLAAGGAHGEH